MSDIQKAIQAILTSVNYTGSGHQPSSGPVVCISRDLGSGGDDIAHRIAERLGVPLYDREILQRIAERLKADPQTIEALDNGTADVRGTWLYGALTARFEIDDYRRTLLNVVLGIGRSGGVILGRGAHIVLANSGALRIRICGSTAVCAQRVAERQGNTLAEAERRVLESNKRRDAFIADTFHVRAEDASLFDLVINTDHFPDPAQVVDLIAGMVKLVRVPTPAGA